MPKDLQVRDVSLPQIVFIAILIGTVCISCSGPEKKDPFLQEAQMVYKDISQRQGNPARNLIRCDWNPWYANMVEFPYLHGVPYLPYFCYNVLLVYPKEAIYAPTWLVTGGSRLQDCSDDCLARNRLEYEKTFRAMWSGENDHANFVNMDEREQKESYVQD